MTKPRSLRSVKDEIGTSLSSLWQCVSRAPGRHVGFCGQPRQVYLTCSTLRTGNIAMEDIITRYVSDPVEQTAFTQANATKI